MASHPHADQLAYAFDVNFSDCSNTIAALLKAQNELDAVLKALYGTGITLKGNTIFRLLGATSLQQIEDAGLNIFLDFKLFDVQSTIANDASWIRLCKAVKILTVSEHIHPSAFVALASTLPNVLIAPVNPLTDLTDVQFEERGEVSRAHATSAFFSRVVKLPAKALVCSPKDLRYGPAGFKNGRTIITPGIRPELKKFEGDTNAVNALTAQGAIRAGADILVAGTMLRDNNDLRGNALRTLDEIGNAMHTRHNQGVLSLEEK